MVRYLRGRWGCRTLRGLLVRGMRDFVYTETEVGVGILRIKKVEMNL